MNKEAKENKYGVHYSQLHAIELVDLDGDGLKDLVTGKRKWAHGPTGDVEPGAPSVLYAFQLLRTKDSVKFMPHVLDTNSGIGTQQTLSRKIKEIFVMGSPANNYISDITSIL